MRVLVIAPSLELVGGQSIQAARLLESLDGEPSVQASFLQTDTLLRGPLRHLRSVRYARTLVRFPLYLTTLLRRIPRCDVVHVFAASFWSFGLNPAPAILVGKLFRKKVVVNYHSGEAHGHLSRSRGAIRALRRADAVVVQSPFLEEIFSRASLDTIVIANHVEADSLPFRNRRPLRPLFLSTRALEPSYDVATLIRAFALIQQRFPEAELRIVGEGSGRAGLEHLARRLRLRAVSFSGIVDPARMAEVYDAADVLLNASTVDSMPLSILEAFACGLPVVSTAAGGIPWVVADAETGLLVRPGDPAELANAAIRLFDDEQLVDRLVAGARAQCSTYSWAATRGDWLAVYGAPETAQSDLEHTPVTH